MDFKNGVQTAGYSGARTVLLIHILFVQSCCSLVQRGPKKGMATYSKVPIIRTGTYNGNFRVRKLIVLDFLDQCFGNSLLYQSEVACTYSYNQDFPPVIPKTW